MKTKTQSGIALATTLIVLFLVVALVVGFSWMVLLDQRLGGVNGAEQYTFYGAEAGLEKLTGDLATLFENDSAPSGAEVNALATAPLAPTIAGIQYLNPNGSLGYQITFPTDASGNPLATDAVIQSGTYQGMSAQLTPYTLTVTSQNAVSHSEIRLTRNVQTVAIPVFQFGMFSQTDLSFFPGPPFDFGGNVMTNGNLFLATGTGPLVFGGKVSSAKDIIRQTLSNGWLTSNGYTGSVYIPTTAGGCPNDPTTNTAGCVALLPTQGSLVGGLGSAINEPTFQNLSLGTYNGYVRNSYTGVKPLNLSIALNAGANPIDLIRRGLPSENTTNPNVLAQRYFSQASVRIIISDNITDITGLPCVTATAPLQLTGTYGGVPVATSGAVSGATTYPDSKTTGYWTATGTPLLGGTAATPSYIKIEIQTAYAVPPNPCGTYLDVTSQVLAFGIAGGNTNPGSYSNYGAANPLPALPGSQVGPTSCAEISPNAIIRLERLRDNPSTASKTSQCGTVSALGSDYWPMALFDAREGDLRDDCPTSPATIAGCSLTTPALGGVMDYTELDVANLAKWLTGALAGSGASAKDPVNSTNDFVVYFSDRRGNYTPAPVTGWPPASPSGFETGEYGFEDSINPSSANGCPNGVLDQGETFDMVENPANQVVGGTPEDYGETPSPNLPAFLKNVNGTALKANLLCSTPSTIWPGWYAVNAQEARENGTVFFRRALMVSHGTNISLGTCPDTEPCGLTIVSENPVYVNGDFNVAPNADGTYGTHVATSIIGDAVTLLSDSWNDVNSFAFPYDITNRAATTTTYRFGVVAGKGISFTQPTTCGPTSCYQDFGTDGGVHNFLRYLENWGGDTLYYKGSVVSFYYSRQAIGVYKDGLSNPDVVYSPPSRGYNFDSDFLTPSLLPPRTPMFRDVNTIGFTQTVLPTP